MVIHVKLQEIMTEQVGSSYSILTCIHQVPSSNIDWDIDYPDRLFWSSLTNVKIITEFQQHMLPSSSFPAHYLLIFVSFCTSVVSIVTSNWLDFWCWIPGRSKRFSVL